jgi:hypothetical protein
MKNSINIQPCKLRLEGTKGGKLMFFICNCPDAKEFKNRVTEDDCNPCSNREGANQPEQRPMPSQTNHGRPRIMTDGVIAYPKRGWEPPPVPEGYRRKCADLKNSDAWIFIPVLPNCPQRTHEVEYGHCGACKITYFCQRDKGARIYDLSTCNKCQGL